MTHIVICVKNEENCPSCIFGRVRTSGHLQKTESGRCLATSKVRVMSLINSHDMKPVSTVVLKTGEHVVG